MNISENYNKTSFNLIAFSKLIIALFLSCFSFLDTCKSHLSQTGYVSEDEIPGYDLFIVLGAIGLVSTLLIARTVKRKNKQI